MAFIKIKENIFYVGTNHWDRRLFDELIPLPDGTSYNSYFIFGEQKTALIDTVDPSTENELFYNLDQLNVKNIDYIISNHAEQDHSGAINSIIKKFPQAKIVTNEKCKNMLIDLLDIPQDKFVIIKEKDKIDLGNKTLEFYMIPWVHWPETMATYLVEDKILFPCDMFGSHIATSNIFDEEHFYIPAKRYYAEIMAPFRNNVINNLDKIKKLEIEIIAPSHGYIYKNPKRIISAYEEWSSDKVKNLAVIFYISMHGSTKKMAEHLKEQLIKRGIDVYFFNLTFTDIGLLAMSLIDASTLVISTPTVLSGIHPVAMYASYLVNILRPKTKFISILSSYGWSEKTLESIKNIITNLKAEFIDPVVVKGLPKESDLKKIESLANIIYLKHKEIGVL